MNEFMTWAEASVIRKELAALRARYDRLWQAVETAVECIGAVHPNAVGIKVLRAALEWKP